MKHSKQKGLEMPNWTQNILLMHAADKEKLINDKGHVDFNLLIPMPEALNQTEGSVTEAAIKYAKGLKSYSEIKPYLANVSETDMEKFIGGEDGNGRYIKKDVDPYRFPHFLLDGKRYVLETAAQVRRLGDICISNKEKYGATTWYDWCCFHWGTKWNACDTIVEELGEYLLVSFNTAWNAPSHELISKMEQVFSKPFIMEAVDEDDQETVYDVRTQSAYDTREARLFEAHVETDDEYEPDEYIWADMKELSEEDARALLG